MLGVMESPHSRVVGLGLDCRCSAWSSWVLTPPRAVFLPHGQPV